MALSPRNALVTEACCHLIRYGISLAEIEVENAQTNPWRAIVEFGLKHRNPDVQAAAAAAMGAVSSLTDTSKDIQR